MEFLRFFLRGLSTLLNAGIPTLRSLHSLLAQQTQAWSRELIERLIFRLSCGECLSAAMKKEPKIFPKVVIGLVLLGEETSSLGPNLERATLYVEQSFQFNAKIYTSLNYPAFLIGVIILGTFMLVNYFLPAFFPLLNEMSAHLPLSTRFLLGVSDAASTIWFWVGVMSLGWMGYFSYLSIRKNEDKRHRLDSILLMIPGVGRVIRSSLFAQLARTLATAQSAGITLGKGLALLEETVENEVFRRFIQDSRLALANGYELSNYFLSRGDFAPSVLGHMMAVGERTGAISFLLPKCTRMLEEETEYFLSQFLKFIEPTLLALLGFFVTFVMTSVFSPLYAAVGAIR